MKPKVLLIGATGLFGERLAQRLAEWPDIDLILAARNQAPLAVLAGRLGCRWARFDRAAPDPGALAVFAVLDCAGPFQDSDYALPRAAVGAGAHYLDIADGRGFVAGFRNAMDAPAMLAGRAVICGASSTPALSHAALNRITAGWTALDKVVVFISPAGQTPLGLSVVRAILSWAGRPVRVFSCGQWGWRAGWSMLQRRALPGVGRRWAALAETPDLDLLAERAGPRQEAVFLAGLESPLLHLGLWLAAWPVRLGLMRSLSPLARPMRALAALVSRFGSADGGMSVTAEGRDAQGRETIARWALTARENEGPHVPTLAMAAALRALLEGRLEPGARVCAGVIPLEAMMDQAAGLPIGAGVVAAWPAERGLFPRLLGPAFDKLPAPVQAVHAGLEPRRFCGQARARGAGGLAVLARAVAGISLGRFDDFSVEIIPERGGERWIRRFGARAFATRLQPSEDGPGAFEERLGPLRFRLCAEGGANGFRWRPDGLSLGPLPLPTFLAPRIRARSSARDGIYRFHVVVSHPWTGLIVGYSGRLDG